MRPKGIDPFAQQNLFGGQGTVFVYDLLQGRVTPPFDAVLACELAPGGSVGKHVQEFSHEIIIVVRGEGTAMVDSESQDLGSGSVVHVAHGQSLSLQNSSDQQALSYLIVKASSD